MPAQYSEPVKRGEDKCMEREQVRRHNGVERGRGLMGERGPAGAQFSSALHGQRFRLRTRQARTIS